MEYITVKEAAEKWGVTARRVQILCSQNRIEGVQRFGNRLMIPCDAEYPTNPKLKSVKDAERIPFDFDASIPKYSPFLYMTDLYSHPGSADESAIALAYDEEAYLHFQAEVAYSRGQIDKVYEIASGFLSRKSSFYAMLATGKLLAFCAIWRGDLQLWRAAKQYIAHTPAKTDNDRDILFLTISAVDSMLYDVTAFPEWFKIGCFEPLPKDSLPAARVFYAKYLYASAYAVATRQTELYGVKGLSFMSVLPLALEPMVSQAMADNSIMSEAYLRMICATVYYNAGNENQAIRHLDRAIALMLPDKMYGFLAEYCRTLGPLLQQRLMLVDPEAWKVIQRLYKVYNEGWSKLSGSIRGKNIITTLSPKEREVAKLAAFGMQNSEIAAKLHMSLAGVKQAIRIVSEKTGVSRDEFASYL